PRVDEFFYRLRPIVSTIVDKNHFVYELSDDRMERYDELFFKPRYQVKKLPSYHPGSASNPFKTFADIPSRSRYKFMLDDASFFVAGFIKGPVCRGQIALNVIRDRFWISFFDPDLEFLEGGAEFLTRNSRFLSLPTKEGEAREDLVYALLRNEALNNVSFLFAENLRREPEKDTITVVPGFIGSFPNFFFSVEMKHLGQFVELLGTARSEKDFEKLYGTFGIRRNHRRFWRHADWFNEKNRQAHPIEGGLFDLNRYDNL
ncbi:MAG: fatty acid cis/trans isomerase, partial [Pseudomonadota bacterium]